MTDFLIRNALIVDGSGEAPYNGDIAVSGQAISDVGKLEGIEAAEVIEADGKVVAPGFIDMHSHSDILFANGSLIEHKARQGVTTELLGQDGFSITPVTEQSINHLEAFFSSVSGQLENGLQCWDMDGFIEHLERKQMHLNMATLIGNANLRLAVMGHKMGQASPDEMDRMRSLLDECMNIGAYGLSLGLIYPPSAYSDTAELVEMGRVLRKHDGVMIAHMRNEQAGILEGVQEMIDIGEKSGCRIHISHLKCLGKESWGKIPVILEMLEKASAKGIETSFDQYPYEASNTSLSALLPPWSQEGGFEGFKEKLEDSAKRNEILQVVARNIESRGGPGSIIIAAVMSADNKDLIGNSVEYLAENWKLPAEEAALQLLTNEQLQVLAIYHAISEADVEKAMMHPMQTVGSDGVTGIFPHPRAYGTFPRVIHRYSHEKKLFPLEKAIQKMTSAPASILRMKQRGKIEKGCFADLVLFEQGQLQDNATFEEPSKQATGLEWMFVNGVPTLRNGEITGTMSGSVLKSKK